jgi:RNA polymerase sigma-70 factor (ECF subfamily)
MIFPFLTRWSRHRRAAKAQLRARAYRRIVEQAQGRAGPPAIALARLHCARRVDVNIDPLETECRLHPAGIAVRAWFVLPADESMAPPTGPVLSSIRKLRPLSPTDRRIFFLSTAYGVGFKDIAILLDLRAGHVRKAMLRAIACLDGKGDE